LEWVLESVEQVDEVLNDRMSTDAAEKNRQRAAHMKSMERSRKNQSNRLAQKKIVKGHKFANKNPNEEVEQVDEISQGVKDRYVSKAVDDHGHQNTMRRNSKAGTSVNDMAKRKERNRKRGISRAFGEDVEQVDELSTKLLKRYDRKNATSGANLRKTMDKTIATVRKSSSGYATPKQAARFTKAMDKHSNRMDGANRSQQIQLKRAQKESVEHLDELTQREKDMIADRKAKRQTKAGRKDKKTRLIPKTTTYVRPSKGEDDHIVMQLRKAQDLDGKFDIRVSPVKGADTVRLKKPQIDKLLAVHDKLDKPDQKRKYRITLLKTLRSMQQKGN
jgi:hypothetical protein